MGYPKVYRLSNGGYVQFTAPNTTAKSIYLDGLHGAPKEKIGVSTWMESELGDAVLVYEHPYSPPAEQSTTHQAKFPVSFRWKEDSNGRPDIVTFYGPDDVALDIAGGEWRLDECVESQPRYWFPCATPPEHLHSPLSVDPEGDAREQIGNRCESGCATKPEAAERGQHQEQLDRIQQKLLDKIEMQIDLQKQFISSEPSTMQHDEPLTKRERFAMEAMVAIIGKKPYGTGTPDGASSYRETAGGARNYADALLAELAKKPA